MGITSGYGNLVWDWSITEVLRLTLPKRTMELKRHKNAIYHVFTTPVGDVEATTFKFFKRSKKNTFCLLRMGKTSVMGKWFGNWSATEVVREKGHSVLGIPFGSGISETGPQPRFYLTVPHWYLALIDLLLLNQFPVMARLPTTSVYRMPYGISLGKSRDISVTFLGGGERDGVSESKMWTIITYAFSLTTLWKIVNASCNWFTVPSSLTVRAYPIKDTKNKTAVTYKYMQIDEISFDYHGCFNQKNRRN